MFEALPCPAWRAPFESCHDVRRVAIEHFPFATDPVVLPVLWLPAKAFDFGGSSPRQGKRPCLRQVPLASRLLSLRIGSMAIPAACVTPAEVPGLGHFDGGGVTLPIEVRRLVLNSEFKWNDSCFQVERFLLHGKELTFRLRPGQSREKLKVSVSMVSVTRINDMQDEIFADAIGEINVTSSVVRLDFVSLSPTERDENNNPKAVFRQRIVMPIGALGNAADLISRVMDNLVKSGAIRYEPA